MTAFNVVRFKVKAGQEQAFVQAHRDVKAFPGMRRFSLVKTGDRSYCLIGQWDNLSDLAKARPSMIGQLDKLRGMLEDLGGGLGVTDPVSGEAVLEATG